MKNSGNTPGRDPCTFRVIATLWMRRIWSNVNCWTDAPALEEAGTAAWKEVPYRVQNLIVGVIVGECQHTYREVVALVHQRPPRQGWKPPLEHLVTRSQFSTFRRRHGAHLSEVPTV